MIGFTPSRGGKSATRAGGSADENNSDETQLLNEIEDWATSESAGSNEGERSRGDDRSLSRQSDAGAAGGSSGAQEAPQQLRKRGGGPSASTLKQVKAPQPSRSMKEFRDAAPLESRAPSLLASIDFDVVFHAANTVMLKARRYGLTIPLEYTLARTPKTQAWVSQHGTEPLVQLAALAIVVLFLLLLPTSHLPPTLSELGSSRWIELPVGLCLALKFNDLGGRLWSYVAPAAVTGGRSHGSSSNAS